MKQVTHSNFKMFKGILFGDREKQNLASTYWRRSPGKISKAMYTLVD